MLQLIDALPSHWKAALQGALLGDALGVPHEFKNAGGVPAAPDIHMVMPAGYPKTYSAIPYGRWSDDGSQMLALLSALAKARGVYDEDQFLSNMLAWWKTGRFQAGGVVFDIGSQTRSALEDREAGRPLRTWDPSYCGNGSLMRVLPVAFLPELFGVPKDQAIATAMAQSSLTHPQLLARVSCALYIELCWVLAERPGGSLVGRVGEADAILRHRGLLTPDEVRSLDVLVDFRKREMPTGSGYVVNTFWSALWAASQANSLSGALRAAVSLGNDTDTVACVAGGLAGLRDGLDKLSDTWWDQMDLTALQEP